MGCKDSSIQMATRLPCSIWIGLPHPDKLLATGCFKCIQLILRLSGGIGGKMRVWGSHLPSRNYLVTYLLAYLLYSTLLTSIN